MIDLADANHDEVIVSKVSVQDLYDLNAIHDNIYQHKDQHNYKNSHVENNIYLERCDIDNEVSRSIISKYFSHDINSYITSFEYVYPCTVAHQDEHLFVSRIQNVQAESSAIPQNMIGTIYWHFDKNMPDTRRNCFIYLNDVY